MQRSHFISRALHRKKNRNVVQGGGKMLQSEVKKMEVSESHLRCNLQQLRCLSKLIKTGHLQTLVRGNITLFPEAQHVTVSSHSQQALSYFAWCFQPLTRLNSFLPLCESITWASLKQPCPMPTSGTAAPEGSRKSVMLIRCTAPHSSHQQAGRSPWQTLWEQSSKPFSRNLQPLASSLQAEPPTASCLTTARLSWAKAGLQRPLKRSSTFLFRFGSIAVGHDEYWDL